MCFKRRSIFGLLKTFYQGSCTQLVISQPHTHEGVRLFPLQREAVKYKPRCATFPTPQGGVFFFSNATKASSTKHLLQGNLGGQLVRHCSRIAKVVGYNPTEWYASLLYILVKPNYFKKKIVILDAKSKPACIVSGANASDGYLPVPPHCTVTFSPPLALGHVRSPTVSCWHCWQVAWCTVCSNAAI